MENKNIDNDYPLIPMHEITEEARQMAVRWGENMVDDFINQKHKLASDIMNYARRYAAQQLEAAAPVQVIQYMLVIMAKQMLSANAATMDLKQECTLNNERYTIECQLKLKK